jgi:hypothetical protein
MTPDAPICHQLPLRSGSYIAQIVVPANLSKEEANLLCAFLQTLTVPETLIEQGAV